MGLSVPDHQKNNGSTANKLNFQHVRMYNIPLYFLYSLLELLQTWAKALVLTLISSFIIWKKFSFLSHTMTFWREIKTASWRAKSTHQRSSVQLMLGTPLEVPADGENCVGICPTSLQLSRQGKLLHLRRSYRTKGWKMCKILVLEVEEKRNTFENQSITAR